MSRVCRRKKLNHASIGVGKMHPKENYIAKSATKKVKQQHSPTQQAYKYGKVCKRKTKDKTDGHKLPYEV